MKQTEDFLQDYVKYENFCHCTHTKPSMIIMITDRKILQLNVEIPRNSVNFMAWLRIPQSVKKCGC